MNAFDKVFGYESIKKELLMICDVLKSPDKYEKLGVTPPHGVLLYGDPGLGKSLMAGCFIEESGCNSYVIRKDRPNGAFVDEIRKTFEEAKKNAPSIVFLDDMDKFANEDNQHPNAEEYVTVQACIDECRDSRVFVLSTVNDRMCLPESLLRPGRFDKVIPIEYPAPADAEKIIRRYLDEKQIVDDIDIEELTRLLENNSCAQLEKVINDAGIYAGYLGKDKIEYEDLRRACIRMQFEGPETDRMDRGAAETHIAYHEAGHVTVAEVLKPGSVNLVSTVDCSGENGGVVRVRNQTGGYPTKEDIECDIIRALAGKAATEVVFGLEDVGCSCDMENAFRKVTKLIDDDCGLGFDAYEDCFSSEFRKENRDRLVSSEMERYYRRAKKILIEHRDFLDVIHDELMEKRTLTFRDIERIREKVG